MAIVMCWGCGSALPAGKAPSSGTSVLTELRNRGITDTFIVCCDGLRGLPDAIRATWPLADVQLCVVHLVRSALRYTSKKRAVDLQQMSLDVTRRHPLRVERDHVARQPIQTSPPLGHGDRCKLCVAVAWHVEADLARPSTA
jgi:hypothetical protein